MVVKILTCALSYYCCFRLELRGLKRWTQKDLRIGCWATVTILAHAILSKQLYFSPQHTQKKSYLNLLIPTMMTCERVANLALAGDFLCFLCNEKLGLFFFFQIFIRVMKILLFALNFCLLFVLGAILHCPLKWHLGCMTVTNFWIYFGHKYQRWFLLVLIFEYTMKPLQLPFPCGCKQLISNS